MIKNVFEKNVADELVKRLNNLSSDSQRLWGKMTIGQMLAHVNVSYDMAYTSNYPPATGLKKFFLKTFIKGFVTNEKKYSKNSRTAPEFLQTDEKEFEAERKKLIDYIYKVQADGTSKFEGLPSPSFGVLTSKEWNNLFYKHIDHHLRQFGV